MFYQLKPAKQYYNWGGDTFLRRFISKQEDTHPQLPLAELWYGDHPNAPACLYDEHGGIAFYEWLITHQSMLSEKSIHRYGSHLPFLLKLLDVRLPLSIQVHPNKQQAEEGYAQEEEQNKAHDASDRLYKDNNHKPELMVALSDFWLLHGFSEREAILKRIKKHECLQPIAKLLYTQSVKEVYEYIMQADAATLHSWLDPIIYGPVIENLNNPDYWVQFAVNNMGIIRDFPDPSLLSFYLFNLVYLRPGEGIMQVACLPHAYLRGQNIEIMAASDNVLRAGLTQKFVAIDEILRVMDFTSVVPAILSAPEGQYLPQYTYPSCIDDFILSVCTLEMGEECILTTEEASILLVIEGSLMLSSCDANKQIMLVMGEAAFVSHHSSIMVHAIASNVRWAWASSVS